MPASDARSGAPILPPSSTILVVDDSPMNLQVLVRTLHGTGHRILAARGGRAALEIARRARPDLMLLDVMMPEVDGFEVCRAIKADPATEDTAIIFLSALGDVTDKVSGLQLGAVDYITKPIQAEEVLARVSNHLTRRYLEREVRQNRDSLERELSSAVGMQRLILPRTLPADSSIAFAAYYRPSRYAGGDYYDVIDLGDRSFAVIVADVSGHGASAAIVMAMLRAVLHTYPADRADPSAVLHYLNRHFRYLWDTAIFATAIYGVVDARRCTFRFSSAGHPAPLLIGDGRAVAPIPVESVQALFWNELGHVPCHEHTLGAGDRVVIYSDGITERQGPGGTFYDPERLTAALTRIGPRPPVEIVERLIADLDEFASGHEPEDDQTLLVAALA